MATTSVVLSEDQFQCSICLDVFTEPVSIPCGHNFCQACLTMLCEGKAQCQCPLCNRKFNAGLKLCVNTALRDVVESFKKHHAAADSDVPVGPGQVPCDCCLDGTMKASKTCLVCLASFCKLHLEPHQRVAAFKRHKLVDPVEDLQGKICKEHGGILELSCRTDEPRVCILCKERGGPAAVAVEEGHVNREAQIRERSEEEEIKQRGWRRGRGHGRRKRKGDSEERAAGMQPDGERSPSSPREIAWSDCTSMAATRGASSGRWYYEVSTEGNTCWDVGVARESVRRDRNYSQNGKWIIRLGYCNYRALHTIPVLGRKPEILIVLVDYEKGLVSFYDADTAAPLHIFTGCEFRERVFLFFRPSHSRRISCSRTLLTPVEKRKRREAMTFLEILILLLLWKIYWTL